MSISASALARAFLSVLVTTGSLTAARAAQASERITPVLLSVRDAPIPFTGSDGRTHLVYELGLTNFSSAAVTVEKVEVLGDGAILETLDTAAIASRLQSAGVRESVGTLAKSTQALLFLHVVLMPGAGIPAHLEHRIALRVSAAPPGQQELTETGGTTQTDRRQVAVIGPPLLGARYISADSCCDAVRHTRAALPVNGQVWIAQRFAVDWEQLDATGRIYAGPPEKLESYTIFGQKAIAVADAVVSSVVEGQPEQKPGIYPAGISLDAADGNAVILDLGNRRYALYAHLQPGSIKVRPGEKVVRGQVLGLVGNTGNSLAPHLHFQVTDGPSSLSSNGLPYAIDAFQITAKTAGTAAFDEAESKGTVLPMTAVSPPQDVKSALPLDQLVVSFVKH